MTGWSVLGWAGITSLSIAIVSVGVAFSRIMWRAARVSNDRTDVFRGKA